MQLEVELNYLFREVKRNIVTIINRATGDYEYNGYKVNKEDVSLLNYYLNLENVIFNYELLLQSNLLLFCNLQERFVSTTDPQELKLIKNIVNILRKVNTSEISNLVVEDTYLINKEKASLFRGAIKNTPFSISNRLKDEKEKESVTALIMVLNAQSDRIKLYLNGIDVKITADLIEEVANEEDYREYLTYKVQKALDILEADSTAINEQAYINKLYFEFFLEQCVKNVNIVEPGYDLISRYTNKKIH